MKESKTCHTFLENVDNVPDMDEALNIRMKAEARFIRAFLYFRLTTQYGDVPLFDGNLSLEEANSIARSPKAGVARFCSRRIERNSNHASSKGRI